MQKGFSKRFIFLLLLIYGGRYFAQRSNFSLPSFKTGMFAHQKPALNFFTHTYSFVNSGYSFSEAFHATKRPVFCRMEDNLHKRFNVWIVLRAGLDSDYRKLIAPQN